MANCVLVHGAWHGGWCWKKVSPLLRQQGHEVFTPTLTGSGERSHLLTREVNLSTFVQDIVAALKYEDLNDVILVGHSFAGMVITGVADRVPDKLARLVYLDSTMPSAGRSFMDVNTATLGRTVQQAVDSDGDGWRLPPFSLSSMGVTDAEDLEWMESKMCVTTLLPPLLNHCNSIA